MKAVKRSSNFKVLFFMVTLPGFITPLHSFADGGGVYTPYDINRDGFLDQEEFKVFLQKRRIKPAYVHLWSFGKVDLDKDKKISQVEMSRTLNKEMEIRLNKQQNRMDAGKGLGPGMGRNMPTFSEFDLDADGDITETELNEARGQRISERAKKGFRMQGLGSSPTFADMDSDGDGKLTPEEFKEAQVKHRQDIQQR